MAEIDTSKHDLLKEIKEYVKFNYDENAYSKIDRQGYYNVFIDLGDTEEAEVWGISKDEMEAWANAIDKIESYLNYIDKQEKINDKQS